MCFVVSNIRTGRCMACEKETECFEVECPKQSLKGLLCPQEFKKQVRLITASPGRLAAGGAPAAPGANGGPQD